MIHDVSIPAALIAGLVSFLSPCVLPLVPPYLIYLTGATIEHVESDEEAAASKRAIMMSALLFVLGFSTVFVALGASASLIGGLIRAWSADLSILADIVIIVMGLHFVGLTRIGLLMVITGIGFLTGAVSNVSIWLLETFPALQTNG